MPGLAAVAAASHLAPYIQLSAQPEDHAVGAEDVTCDVKCAIEIAPFGMRFACATRAR